MKYIFLILSSIVFIFSACGTSKPQVIVAPKTLPSWYTNPPHSNDAELYALGEGKDKKEAIAEALSFMASTLSVSISSDYNARTEVREGSVNSAEGVYKSDITSKVASIRISSYEVLYAESLGFKRYAVLIKSNKAKLFTSMLQELNQKFTSIENQKKSLKNANALDKLHFYKEQKAYLKSIPNTLIVMNVLNPQFEGDESIRKTQVIAAEYQDILQRISFEIGSNTAASNLKVVIGKGISEKRFKIKKAKGPMHFTIYIKSDIEKARSYGFWLARSEITIKTKDYKGSIVSSNRIEIVGQSSQNFAIAKQNVAFRLNTLIEKEGIGNVLGLDI